MYVRLLVTVLLFFLNSCHFYKGINSQTVGSWSLKPDNLLKWEPSTPEILWWVLLKSSAFGFLFVVLTSLVGNGESGSRVCAEVKGVQYKVTSLTIIVLSLLFSWFIGLTGIHTWSFKHLWLQEESHIDCSSGYIHHNTALWWEEASSRSLPFTFFLWTETIPLKTIADIELLADISVATGVAEGTIRNSYKDLYPHLPKIIPAWYAKEEDLKNLQSPWVLSSSSLLLVITHLPRLLVW